MGPGSIVLGITAFAMMLGGILFTLVPVLGSVLSFGAPAVSLAGLIVGGIGYSQARREMESAGAPVAGMVLSGVAFLMSFAFALVCGTCNAFVTAVGTSSDLSPFLQVDTGSMPMPAPLPPPSSGAVPVAPAPPPLPPPPRAPGLPPAAGSSGLPPAPAPSGLPSAATTP
ncbi:MAG: hypothetical protein AAF447_03660 [Myxococcota bacterium]